MNEKVVKIPKVLSVFTLAMINVAALGSVKNWPFSAEYGFSSLFYFILAALVFFFPVSFVSAELATGWPKKGGVYLWVKEAFGPKAGLLAVWLQWVNNITWYPTVLSITAATIAYIFKPELASNNVYTLVTILILFWTATIFNLFGMKISGWMSSLGGICGTLIPGVIIITLGMFWFFSDSPSQIEFTLDSLIPNFDFKHMALFTGVMLAFAGMEMSGVHALDVKHPRKDYPKAILISALIILVSSILGVLSIAMVVPKEAISFTAGTMQAFAIFFNKYKLGSFVPVIAFLVAVGVFGSVGTWIIGPAKGLLAAAQDGHLPAIFHRINKKNAPSALMLFQGALTTAFTFIFLFMPNVSSAFWILSVLTAQLYLMMYILLFAAALRLRYSKPNVERPFKVPGGNFGIWLICGLGIIGAAFALVIGYFDPPQIETGSRVFYLGFLLFGSLVGLLGPFVITLFEKPSWKN